ncbi:hypothetical protein GLE_3521 [Lysobacter enzymogenes]|uniref:Uncharacterized protein n=1 Tax=Lysobacter enzymogenes TaxID=69 RepID=A0A0S2DKC2_LYSEN|nr:hypothetical protein GLE_3521 [Lysobacter enzymogenes]
MLREQTGPPPGPDPRSCNGLPGRQAPSLTTGMGAGPSRRRARRTRLRLTRANSLKCRKTAQNFCASPRAFDDFSFHFNDLSKSSTSAQRR